MTELEVSTAATADLDEIFRFSLERFGEERALRYLDEIEATILRLRRYPDSGTIYTGLTMPVRFATSGSHRVFYTRRADHLLVIRVLHQAMRAEGRLA